MLVKNIRKDTVWFLSGKHLRVELPDQLVCVCLVLLDTPDCFPEWLILCFTFPSVMYKLSSFCVFSLVLGIARFWGFLNNFTILLGVKWYLIVILFCISQMINDVEYLFICSFTVCNCLFKLYPICLLDSFLIFEYWGNSIFWIPVL